MDKSLLKIAGIISIIVGILFCLTLIGAIVGVPIIIGGCKFKDYANLSDEELKDICDYAIVTGVVEGGCPKCFHGEVPIAELKLPPYHPGCECIVRYHEKGTEELV